MTTDELRDAVRVESLTKTFPATGSRAKADAVHAVREVSLTVRQGECLGIAGESGSGKSTLARMLVGLEKPTSGRFLVDGEHLPDRPGAADRRRHARRIQMVFQDPYSSLDPRQPVGMVLDEVQRVHFDRDRAGRNTRTAELLEAVGLGKNYNESVPRSLSGGQRQRLAIARALAAEPSVIVLDEAVSSLDVSIQAQILNLLGDLRRELSLTYVFISHDLAVIRQVSDRVLVLYRGELMEQASVDEIFGSAMHPYSRLLLDSVPQPGMSLSRRPDRAATSESGCLFRERCPSAHDRCIEEPPLFQIETGAQSRCWLVAEHPTAVLTKEEA